jgi:hypothetical protein
MEKIMSSNEAHSHLPLFPPEQTFGAEVSGLARRDSAEQPALSIEARREIIMRVFDTAGGHFISSYVKCLVEYGLTHQDFIAGDVTALFEKRNGLLTIHEAKSLGGLFMQLQRKGVIEKTGTFRSRNQGSPAAVYRLKK